jgi:hypothetical protein
MESRHMASEVGSAYFTLLPSVKGLQGSIAKEVSGIDGTAAGDSIGKKMGGGIVGSIKSLVGPALLAMGGAAAFSFAKDAVASFSELEDSSAAAAVTFSGNMDRITTLSKAGASTLGLSSQQVVSSAQNFGVFGKAAGLAGEDLESFAVDMTTLSGDLSSFSGKSTEDAIAAVGSAMRGEFEPIRSFGVLLDDATLKAEAMSMGLITTTKDALTPQQKTLAAQSAIMKQTTDAQGDFNRTSMSTANVAKTLAAESENVSAKFGKLMAPAFTAVRVQALIGLQGLSELLDGAETFLPRVGMAWTGLTDLFLKGDFKGEGGLGQALGIEEDDPIVGVLFTIRETAISAFGGFMEIVRPLAPLVLELFRAVSPMGIVFQSLAPVLPALAGAFGQLAQSLGSALGTTLTMILPVLTQLSEILVQSLGTIFTALAPVIVSLLGQLGATFTELAPVIGTVIGIVAQLVGTLVAQLMPILLGLFSDVMPMVVEAFSLIMSAIVPLVTMLASVLIPIIQALMPVVVTVFSVVADVIRNVMQIILGIIQVVTGIISGDWEQVWEGIGNIFGGIWNTIVAVVGGAIAIVWSVIQAGLGLVSGFVGSILGNIGNFFSDTWRNITNGVSGFIDGFVGFFRDLPGTIMNLLAGAGSWLTDIGKNTIQGLIDGAGGLLRNLGTFFLDIVPEFIRGPFKAALGIASPSKVFRGYGVNLGEGLILGVDDMQGPISKAVTGMVELPTAPLARAGGRYGYDVSRGQYSSGTKVEQNIYPRENMSEETVAEIAARKLERAGVS